MDEDLVRLREVAKKRLHKKIVDAYTKFDTKKAISMIEERIIGEMEDVTDKILGIDRRWSEIEVKEGRIRSMLDAEITRVLDTKVKPLIEEQVARIIEYKLVNVAIKRAIKNRVDSALYAIEHYNNSEIGIALDRVVKVHIDEAMREYIDLNTPQ